MAQTKRTGRERVRSVRRPEVTQPDSPLATIRALAGASVLVDRFKLAQRAGITFGGKRDIYEVLGYKKELSVADFRSRYARNGIAARIVEALPKATWRGGGEVIEDEDPKVTTKFEKAWEQLDKRLSVWSTFLKADILAGIGRYSVILIGAPGDLQSELPTMKSPDAIAYLTPFCEDDAIVQELETDPKNERYGLPTLYTLRRTTARAGIATANDIVDRMVHWTRIVHVADGTLDDPIFGRPRLEKVWNLLDDLDKITGAGSEAFWLRAHQGFVALIDKDAEIDQEELKQMKAHVEEFAHQLRRTMGLRGTTDFKSLGSDTANIGPNVDSILQLISGACEIPKRILTGSEMGELASTQDTANWNVRVMDRRDEFAGPHVVRPFVDRLIEFGALPESDDYEVRWPDMRHLSDQEKAAVAGQWAGLNSAAGATVVTPDEIRERVLDLPPLADVVDEPTAQGVLTPGQPAPQMQPQQPQPPQAGGQPPVPAEPKPQPGGEVGQSVPKPKKGGEPPAARAAASGSRRAFAWPARQ